MKIQFPYDFSKVLNPDDTAGNILTIIPSPDLIDDIKMGFDKVTQILAPHDGELTNRAESKDVLIKANGYGSILHLFALDPKFIGAKDVKVKKGEVIGSTVIVPGFLSWTAIVPKPGTKGGFMNLNPLILAGALGGIDFQGIKDGDVYVKDVKKSLGGLTSTIGTHALAFAGGWIVAKA